MCNESNIWYAYSMKYFKFIEKPSFFRSMWKKIIFTFVCNVCNECGQRWTQSLHEESGNDNQIEIAASDIEWCRVAPNFYTNYYHLSLVESKL